jgi:hypothetical protein
MLMVMANLSFTHFPQDRDFTIDLWNFITRVVVAHRNGDDDDDDDFLSYKADLLSQEVTFRGKDTVRF